MEQIKIDIAKEFSQVLGGRWKKLGPFSGEAFYEDLLEKRFKEAQNSDQKLHIYLDNAKGYGSSFLDQSFGELARNYQTETVRRIIEFHTGEFRWIVEYINTEIWQKKS
jgi:hypothetical protein